MTVLKEERGNQREELESYLETVSSFGILLINSDQNILDCNQGFMKIFQLQQKPLGSPVDDFLMLGDTGLKYTEEFRLSCNHQSGLDDVLHCRTVEAESGYLLFCKRLILTENQMIEQMGTIRI
jgi:hypothetical protein